MKVFLSYRRDDSRHVTGRLWDTVHRAFPDYDVFMDVDRIPPGVDFRTYIDEFVSSCDLVLAIIGPDWLNIEDTKGSRRLDDQNDFVRLEISAALARQIKVIPVLVDHAKMPQVQELPEDIKALAWLNATPLRPDPDYARDAQNIIQAMCEMKGYPGRIMHYKRLLLILAAIAVVGAGGYLTFSSFEKIGLDKKTNTNESLISEDGSAIVKSEHMSNSEVTKRDPVHPVVAYDPKFLRKVEVPLPHVTLQAAAGDMLDGMVLDYVHYSLVMDERRAMPLYVAINYDRSRLIRVHRANGWQIDPRIDRDLQRGQAVYRNNEWDRGHLASRSKLTWGEADVAAAASLTANYYTNTVPQNAKFNQGWWLALENHISKDLFPESQRLSIFTGPVHRRTDIEYRGGRIPQSFWKIVAAEDAANPRRLKVQAFLMDQYRLTNDDGYELILWPPEGGRDLVNLANFRVSIAEIERLTPLNFGRLKDFEVPPEGLSQVEKTELEHGLLRVIEYRNEKS